MIITRYIIKEHFGPFIFSLLTIIFIFILNITFRDLGRMLGKGLPVTVILEYFFLNIAWIIALAIPMAILIATLMAFGRLSGENEITALKASGVHPYRLILPVLIASVVLGVTLERFNNTVLPEFNHRVRLLYGDISRKRPTLALEPHVFFNDFPGTSLLVREIEEDGNMLKGIILTDSRDANSLKTITANYGYIKYLQAQELMQFFLFDGEIHEIEMQDMEEYRRLKFTRHVTSIPVKDMELERSNSEHRGDREKNARMMLDDIDRNLEAVKEREARICSLAVHDLSLVFTGIAGSAGMFQDLPFIKGKPAARIRAVQQQIKNELSVIDRYRISNRSLLVEIHKKYSIPVACLVFVLIGAPLGVMGRQGGLAVGMAMSISFFMVYWAFLIGGEQLADRGFLNPALAMWLPNFIVGIGGIFLMMRVLRENSKIQFSWLTALITRFKRAGQ